MKQKFKIWKTITLGTKPDLSGIKVTSWAQELLDKTKYSTKKERVDLVLVGIGDLGFKDMATTKQIYTKAKKLGLELCPAEIGPHLRAVYKDQPLYEWIRIGMKQIAASGGHPSVFELLRLGDDLWLDGSWAIPTNLWGPGPRFVFRIRKFLRPSVSPLKLRTSKKRLTTADWCEHNRNMRGIWTRCHICNPRKNYKHTKSYLEKKRKPTPFTATASWLEKKAKGVSPVMASPYGLRPKQEKKVDLCHFGIKDCWVCKESPKTKQECKHRWQIVPMTLGAQVYVGYDAVAVCEKCLEKKYI